MSDSVRCPNCQTTFEFHYESEYGAEFGMECSKCGANVEIEVYFAFQAIGYAPPPPTADESQ